MQNIIFKWPHSPVHKFDSDCTYMVTAGTYQKAHFFKSHESLDYLQNLILTEAESFNWKLQAWAIFSNHYHFVANSPTNPQNLKKLIQNIHAKASAKINALDKTPGRRVWYQYWDSQLTNQKSYMARLSYVHQNPVRHKLVEVASEYPWCSAEWFEKFGNKSFVESVYRFKTDTLRCFDEF